MVPALCFRKVSKTLSHRGLWVAGSKIYRLFQYPCASLSPFIFPSASLPTFTSYFQSSFIVVAAASLLAKSTFSSLYCWAFWNCFCYGLLCLVSFSNWRNFRYGHYSADTAFPPNPPAFCSPQHKDCGLSFAVTWPLYLPPPVSIHILWDIPKIPNFFSSPLKL